MTKRARESYREFIQREKRLKVFIFDKNYFCELNYKNKYLPNIQ